MNFDLNTKADHVKYDADELVSVLKIMNGSLKSITDCEIDTDEFLETVKVFCEAAVGASRNRSENKSDSLDDNLLL